jgi:hypothetical protein
MDFGERVDRITGRVAALLERGVWAGVLGVLLLLPVPYLLGVSNLSSLALGLVFCGVALLLGQSESKSDRSLFLSLFAWSYVVRLSALLLLSWVLFPGDTTFLGPDGTTYFGVSQGLAANGLSFGETPLTVLENYHVAPYYLFASVLYLFRGDLFTLQLLNSGLGALVPPLIFSLCRSVVPRYALPIGMIVALHPSLIAVSAKDLLKDPSVLFFTVLAIWSLTKMLQEESIPSLVGFAFAGVMSLGYLRMARFYVVFYLELAIVCVLLLHWLRRIPILDGDRRGVAAMVLVFAGAEIGPMALGWPSSFRLFYDSVLYTFKTPAMQYYAVGWCDALIGSGVATGLCNLFRKLYGPFVWILPENWDIRYILANQFLLYPGMVIWYALLPFIGVGLVAVGSGVIGGREKNPRMIVLWAFLLLYFTMYLAINLSMRQREVMLPLLLVFAFIGTASATKYRYWRGVYGTYWVSIAFVAVSHLLLRTLIS